MKGHLLGILCLALLLVLGCSKPDRDVTEIGKTLAIRADALNARDSSQYLSVISLRYYDKNIYFQQLKENLEKNFRDFEQISYKAGTPSITVEGSRAESTVSYCMKVHLRGKEMTLNGIEHLTLAKEPEGWKIIAGI